MSTIIAKCNCEHTSQDEMYGKGMRVWNSLGKEGKEFRCTVCGAKTGGSGITKKK